MDDLPKPTLADSIAALRHRDEYKVIIDFLKGEREAMFAEFGTAPDPNEVMKLAGGIARTDEIIKLLDQ